MVVKSMTSKKISISLPDELLNFIDTATKKLGISRSEYITRTLQEKIGSVSPEKPKRYPTVLWKLAKTGFLKFRSPRYPSRRIKERWIVKEADEIE